MGVYLISVPDFSDSELVFDERETKLIFRFFYPQYSSDIASMTVSNDGRRLAQTLLVAAIDASYGMGFVEALINTISRPNRDITTLGKKLARRFVRHWYKHTTKADLDDVKIYESVRSSISGSLVRTRFFELLSQGQASLTPTGGGLRMYVTAFPGTSFVWG